MTEPVSVAYGYYVNNSGLVLENICGLSQWIPVGDSIEIVLSCSVVNSDRIVFVGVGLFVCSAAWSMVFRGMTHSIYLSSFYMHILYYWILSFFIIYFTELSSFWYRSLNLWNTIFESLTKINTSYYKTWHLCRLSCKKYAFWSLFIPRATSLLDNRLDDPSSVVVLGFIVMSNVVYKYCSIMKNNTRGFNLLSM